MNKIDEMIKRLCPNGVEYRALGDVANVQRGIRVVRKQLSSDAGYPVFQNSLTPLGYHSDFNQENAAFVIGAGAAGEIGFSKERFWAADDCYSIQSGTLLLGKYVYHVLLSRQEAIKAKVRKASIPRLSRIEIERLVIPIPPKEIQQEIVRVLDSFAELEAKLEAELQAELEARKVQYAYYRDQLLNFDRVDNMSAGGSASIRKMDDAG